MKPHANYLVTVKSKKTENLKKEAKQLRAEKGQGKNSKTFQKFYPPAAFFHFLFLTLEYFSRKNVFKIQVNRTKTPFEFDLR